MALTQKLDIQGHRGCRGLFPENSIEGFIHALELGVNTLELDVCISKDHQVIISHDPFFRGEISLTPSGQEISAKAEKNHKLYTLSAVEIKTYDTGSKFYDKFPYQKKIKTYKPRLDELIKAIQDRNKNKGIISDHDYNIEIKRNPKWDDKFHPDYKHFAELVIKKIIELEIVEKTTVQCFDTQTLQYIREKYPDVKLVFLVQNLKSPEKNLQKLGFIPEIYSPYYKLVNKRLVNVCTQNKIRLIPWTVNKKKDMKKLIKMGVDGIITDYPDILIELVKKD